MSINGECPKCGKPFPASRKRCYSCSPGCHKPSSEEPEEVSITLGRRTEVLTADDRRSLLEKMHEVRQVQKNGAATLDPPVREFPSASPRPVEPARVEPSTPPPAKTSPAVVVSTVDLEMASLVAIVDTLRRLDPGAQGRVLDYVSSRFNFKDPS